MKRQRMTSDPIERARLERERESKRVLARLEKEANGREIADVEREIACTDCGVNAGERCCWTNGDARGISLHPHVARKRAAARQRRIQIAADVIKSRIQDMPTHAAWQLATAIDDAQRPTQDPEVQS